MSSRKQIAAGAAAVIVIVAMGFIVFKGPFNLIDRNHAVETSTATPNSTPVTVQVKIVNNAETVGRYEPADIRILESGTIKFTNESNAMHTVTARNGAFNTGNIAPGGTAVVTIRRPGVYPFYCMYHPNMRGIIRVLRGCALGPACPKGNPGH